MPEPKNIVEAIHAIRETIASQAGAVGHIAKNLDAVGLMRPAKDLNVIRFNLVQAYDDLDFALGKHLDTELANARESSTAILQGLLAIATDKNLDAAREAQNPK